MLTYPTLASSLASPTIFPIALDTLGSACAGSNEGEPLSYHKLIRNIEGIIGLDDEHPASSNAAGQQQISKHTLPLLGTRRLFLATK